MLPMFEIVSMSVCKCLSVHNTEGNAGVLAFMRCKALYN